MGNRPFRFGIIGAGMVSDANARSIKEVPGCELAAVFSRTQARARTFGEKYEISWTTDIDELLSRGDIDGVLITTAPYNHEDHAVRAMLAGKHALVEKPMAVSVSGCDRMMSVSEETGKTLGMVFQNRFKKGVRRAKEYVEAGGLGALLHISGHVKWYRPQSYYEANDWRGKISTEGGGVLFSQAGHTLDLMRWIGGPVEWVFANLITAPVHSGIEIENMGVLSLRFANGATAVLEASTALYPGSAERLEIHGSRGTIALEAGNITRWKIKDPGPDDEQGDTEEIMGTGASDPMAFPITWHKAVVADFVESVRARNAGCTSGQMS